MTAMFVRWTSRKRRVPAYGYQGKQLRDHSSPWGFVRTRRETNTQDVHWRAIMVEAVRVDGKPKQRHVAYLGGITQSAIAIIHQRCWFWDRVTQRLDRLRNRILPEDRRRIEAAVAQRVPRPTKAQYARCVRDRNSWLAGTNQKLIELRKFRSVTGR